MVRIFFRTSLMPPNSLIQGANLSARLNAGVIAASVGPPSREMSPATRSGRRYASRGRKSTSRSPARFNRRRDSRSSEGSRSRPEERRRWRRGRKPVEQLVQDQLLVLQEALVAVDQQRGGTPLRVGRMTDLVLVESHSRAERQHGPNHALVMLGDRRETGPQRRQLTRQPDTLPEALSKCVRRVSRCCISAARVGHGCLRPGSSIDPCTELHKMHTGDRVSAARQSPVECYRGGTRPAARSGNCPGSRTYTTPRCRPTKPARASRRSCLLVV